MYVNTCWDLLKERTGRMAEGHRTLGRTQQAPIPIAAISCVPCDPEQTVLHISSLGTKWTCHRLLLALNKLLILDI